MIKFQKKFGGGAVFAILIWVYLCDTSLISVLSIKCGNYNFILYTRFDCFIGRCVDQQLEFEMFPSKFNKTIWCHVGVWLWYYVFNLFLDGSGIVKCTKKMLIIGYLEFGVIYT